MVKVGIVGVSGYTGLELARILSAHPEVEITVATSRQFDGKALASVYPNLKGRVFLNCENLKGAELAQRADFFFTAVPHKSAMEVVPSLLTAGKKVVDLSADFRLDDVDVYESWYTTHTAPEYLTEAVYGLPEVHREQIKSARLVGNPGCYPTSVILGLAPLLKEKAINPLNLIVDSKSGVSGAGRAPKTNTLYCEVTEGFTAYMVGEHRHTPEMEQEIGKLYGEPVTITFTPHLVPMSRGIFSTMYARLQKPLSANDIRELYSSFYTNDYFVRLCDAGTFPATQFVRGSNFCDIGFKLDERTGRMIILSAIDNLVKGAAGQAVQNMNLMCGFNENLGLETAPLFP